MLWYRKNRSQWWKKITDNIDDNIQYFPIPFFCAEGINEYSDKKDNEEAAKDTSNAVDFLSLTTDLDKEFNRFKDFTDFKKTIDGGFKIDYLDGKYDKKKKKDNYENPENVIFIDGNEDSEEYYWFHSNAKHQGFISVRMDELRENLIMSKKSNTAFITENDLETLNDKAKEINEAKDKKVISTFKSISKNNYGLKLDVKDLINFHTSVKTSFLTIVEGISGTGKTQMVNAYADTLGLKKDEDSQFLYVPVRPYWNDDSDLLGTYDYVNKKYVANESGLVDFLIEAEQNPDKLYMVLFDEMNLSRIEHYFSQFLSLLEMDNKSDRKLRLYNESNEDEDSNEENHYPSSITIPDNIRFVGTMNIDESTYSLSDKLIDRTNLIRLTPVKFAGENDSESNDGTADENDSESSDDTADENDSESNNDTADENDSESNNDHTDENVPESNGEATDEVEMIKGDYIEFKSLIIDTSYFDKEENKTLNKDFDKLNEEISNNIPNVGIGWRTYKSIDKFMANIAFFDYDEYYQQDAMDYQIAQRILSKVRGTEEMVKDLLGENSEMIGTIKSILEKIKKPEVKVVGRCDETIKRKNREMEVFGFVNWC